MKELAWFILKHVLACVVLSEVLFATAPLITSVLPVSGTAGTTSYAGAAVTIVGTNFGVPQGSVKFNGTLATITSWTTLITGVTTVHATVPVGASTGPMQVFTQGGTASSNEIEFTVLFTTFPQNWVDNTVCNPPGGTYDAYVTLGLTANIGPNDAGGEGLGNPYPVSYLGLLDAMNNWRDNADNMSQTPHGADVWWHIAVPAGANLHGFTLDANNALVSLPAKIITLTGQEPSKCLVIESTTPLTSGVMACGRGLPGFGGARNPGCDGHTNTGVLPNDVASMWRVQLDGPRPATSGTVVFSGTNPGGDPSGLGCPSGGCWVNHVVLRDVEVTEAPGAAPSGHSGVNAPYLFRADKNVTNTAPPCSSGNVCRVSDNIGLDRYYIHGWDPGDPSQPAAATINAASGSGGVVTYTTTTSSNNLFANEVINIIGLSPSGFNCSSCTVLATGLSSTQFEVTNSTTGSSSGTGTAYDKSESPSGACGVWSNSSGTGTGVTVANDPGNSGTSLVTIPSTGYTGSYFGPTFTVGSVITINGTAYTIASTSYTQGVLNGSQNTMISISTPNVNLTNASFTQSNPPSSYAIGCGDDAVAGAIFNCDSCWRENGYIEKIHWSGSESHSSSQGFSHSAYKDVNNWEEGGSAAWFNGGGPVDQAGGPTSDVEVRRNYFGRDLNYRQLTGAAGGSPAPPWGCGPAVGAPAKQNTCPFPWAVKNSVELKLGVRVLFDGNIIENSWPDGQTGWCVVVGPRTCSGGAACGIYDPATGLPETVINNVRFSNNWVRNCAEPFTTGSRSGSIGNGGGVSLPSTNNDYINNLMTNIHDVNQTGNTGDQWLWGLGQDQYTCAMSYTGTASPYTVTALCNPYQQDVVSKINQISSVANTVQIFYGTGPFGGGERMDPMLCPVGTWSSSVLYGLGNVVTYMSTEYISLQPGNTNKQPNTNPSWWSATTCVNSGEMVVISNHNDWNGSFGMTSTSGEFSGYIDGTGGNGIGYTDTINSPGTTTLCNNTPGTNQLPKCADILEPNLGLTGVTCIGTTCTYNTAVSNPSGAPCTLSGAQCLNGGFAGSTLTFSGFSNSNNNQTLTVTSSTANTLVVTNSLCGTSCNETHTGNATSANDVTFASLGFKMTDISVNDAVYASDVGGGDTSCSGGGYAVGSTSATYAITGTVTTGLKVMYQVGSQPAPSANCIINNGAGFPKFTTLASNTILCPDLCSVQIEKSYQQSISNQFLNNVWSDNDTGTNSDVNCLSESTEGTPSFACWDSNTFEFYTNVVTTRSSTNWTGPKNCPLPGGTGCALSFPTGVNCTGSAATAGCLGYVGFMGSAPTVTYPGQGTVTVSGTAVTWASGATFPTDGSLASQKITINGTICTVSTVTDSHDLTLTTTGCSPHTSPVWYSTIGSCADANAPFNCPLMALPWANNLTLSNLVYCSGSNCSSSSSSYSGDGVDTTQMNNAMTQTEYTCPTGANCGTHGPYPD